MNVNEIIKENEDLRRRYIKAKEAIAKLERKIEKLEKEIGMLRKQNEKLRKKNKILMRAFEIALQIKDYNAQTRHLRTVLERIRRGTGEFKG
jgi:archaellum component FlaC